MFSSRTEDQCLNFDQMGDDCGNFLGTKIFVLKIPRLSCSHNQQVSSIFRCVKPLVNI